ncbi:MAG: FAD-dependent oxidoreductase [Pseudomonadota bacterium]
MTKHEITHFPSHDTTNGWAAFLPPRTPRPPLEGEIRADWIVAGAGLAGLAAARRLAENRPDDKIVVIDAAAAGDGASGRNSGFGIDLPHTVGTNNDENEGAHGYMRLARAALAYLEDIVTTHGIDCDWRTKGKYQTVVTPKVSAEMLEPFGRALEALGEPFEWLDKDALAAKLGTTHNHAAIYTPGCILLNPVALMRGLADTLPENVTLYEHTPAKAVEYRNGTEITTPNGAIRAPKMILGVNAFAEQFGQMKDKILPMLAHASLTRPLTEDERARYGVAEDWGVTPCNSFVGITMRYTSDYRILIRECIRYRPSQHVGAALQARIKARHQRLFDARFPQIAGIPLTHTWTGFVGLSRNGSPGWGEAAPGVWTAVCQNAIGITKGTISGLLAADLACERENPLLGDMAALGTPSNLPPEPIRALGVRGRLLWDLWTARHEA